MTEPTITKSESVFRKRWRKFKTLKRGYYSFWLILLAFALSWGLQFVVNDKALLVRYQGVYTWPVTGFHTGKDYGLDQTGEPDWRKLQEQYRREAQGNWVIMPLYPYGPYSNTLLDMGENVFPPTPPDRDHWFGTDYAGRDVFARLLYGFRISLTFGVLVLLMEYMLGVLVGATLGYCGGRVDIYGQRFVEIWSALPFLYTIMIISSMVKPNLYWLVFLMGIFAWISISFYVRGEYYREKAKDYVAAAYAQGEGGFSIMFRQILPNALTPIISFAPFALVGSISALTALDFLGFGLPAPMPSWGELMEQGLRDIRRNWWLMTAPATALFFTLLMIVFIGEALREAFDPKEFARLR